jgi:hypothetical protein
MTDSPTPVTFGHGFTLIQCATATELWERLSPEAPLAPNPAKFIYRGHGNATWKLEPSVLRDAGIRMMRDLVQPVPLTVEMQIFGETILLRRFIAYCDQLGLRIPNDSMMLRRQLDSNTPEGGDLVHRPNFWPPVELFDLLALAQHHGIPTRLLDWSRRSYVAAYFAASDALKDHEEKKDDDVHELAIWALNIDGIFERIPNDTFYVAGGLYPSINLVRSPGSTSANLAAQAGIFTLLKENGVVRGPLINGSLEEEFKRYPHTPLWKLTLPIAHARDLLNLCEKYSVSAATLFPGYDGAAKAAMEAARAGIPL